MNTDHAKWNELLQAAMTQLQTARPDRQQMNYIASLIRRG